MVTLLSANLNSGFRHHNDSRITAAARLLAFPTVTVHHGDWISFALVTNGATSRTPPDSFCGMVVFLGLEVNECREERRRCGLLEEMVARSIETRG